MRLITIDKVYLIDAYYTFIVLIYMCDLCIVADRYVGLCVL